MTATDSSTGSICNNNNNDDDGMTSPTATAAVRKKRPRSPSCELYTPPSPLEEDAIPATGSSSAGGGGGGGGGGVVDADSASAPAVVHPAWDPSEQQRQSTTTEPFGDNNTVVNKRYRIIWQRLSNPSLPEEHREDSTATSCRTVDDKEEEGVAATIEALVDGTDTTGDIIIALQGRGYVENTSRGGDDDAIIAIHGVSLFPPAHSNSSSTSAPRHRRVILPFDSPPWSSWVTARLAARSRLTVYSSSSSSSIQNILGDSTSHPTLLHSLLDRDNHEIVRTEKETNSTKQKELPVIASTPTFSDSTKPSFAIFDAADRVARPTVIPESWRVAVDAIMHDLSSSNATYNATSACSNQCPVVEGALFFKDSVGGSDDDDNDFDERVPMHAANGDAGEDCTNSTTTREICHGVQIVLCGAKSVGKSTCLRYCLNRLLSDTTSAHTATREVVVLDADPGQPEYGVPGMLQLTLVASPSLLPPHRHVGTLSTTSPVQFDDPIANQDSCDSAINVSSKSRVLLAHYFGSVTSSADPVLYVKCVSSLVEEYKKLLGNYTNQSPPPPLIVNLDGWIKDLGFEILTTLLRDTLNPRHVIQIAGDSLSKALDLSTTMLGIECQLHSCWAYNSSRNKCQIDENVIRNGNAEKIDNTSLSNTLNTASTQQSQNPQGGSSINDSLSHIVPFTLSIPASALRSVRLVTYFMKATNDNDDRGRMLSTLWDRIAVGGSGLDDPMCEIAHALAAVRPYVLSMNAVSVRFVATETAQRDISKSSLLDVLNGSVVGLCHQDCEGSKEPGVVAAAALLPCLGLGLVRAVDRKRQLLFIITPCSAETVLPHINCLTIGCNVHLPLECYFRGVHSEAFPYISFGAGTDSMSLDVIGADPMKSRNTINRRGLGGG